MGGNTEKKRQRERDTGERHMERNRGKET
jgi:hypothetical protein